MTRKNTLKSLPTDTEFRVVGLDLAKSDVSVAAIPVDDNTPSLVDRMTYADLLDWAGKIDRTSEGGHNSRAHKVYVFNFKALSNSV